MNNKKHKLIILQLAGFGDTLSLITRMPAMLKDYPNHDPIVYLGGYGGGVINWMETTRVPENPPACRGLKLPK